VLSLERLSFLEPEGKVGYRSGEDALSQEAMDYLEFIARITSHIPDNGQVTVRYYGLYADAEVMARADRAFFRPREFIVGNRGTESCFPRYFHLDRHDCLLSYRGIPGETRNYKVSR
jgi:hypothetical protein